MKQLQELYQKILDEGVESVDRTGVGTTKLIGQQMRFDLNDGFPAVTTKRLAWKTMVAELLFFIKGIPDRRVMQEFLHGEFNEDKNDIWKGNCVDMKNKNPLKFNGYNLGNMYPVYWRRMYKPVPKTVKVKRKKDFDFEYIEKYKSFYDDVEIEKHHKSGQTFIDIRGDELEYLGFNGQYENKRHYLKYKNTGTIIKLNTSEIDIKHNKLNSGEDYYKKNSVGGYLGAPREVLSNDPLNSKVQSLWYNMLSRVNTSPNYNNISVSPRWYNYYNFLTDIRTIPLFFEWLDDPTYYELDKDYFGSSVYSRNTCTFLPKHINQKLIRKRNDCALEVDGILYYSFTCFYKSIYGGKTQPKDPFTFLENNGHTYIIHEETDEYVYRPQLFIDQLETVIENIKHVTLNENHPAGRRLIMDSWNPSWEDDSVLGICHPFVQFFVVNGKLSCEFYMRSSDTFLGLPLNISSYALLTHMIAQITGLEVGELIYTAGDCHIYKNHIDQVKEQLQRKPRALPELWIDPTITDIEDFTMDSFKLINYDPMPTIKAPMAV